MFLGSVKRKKIMPDSDGVTKKSGNQRKLQSNETVICLRDMYMYLDSRTEYTKTSCTSLHFSLIATIFNENENGNPVLTPV